LRVYWAIASLGICATTAVGVNEYIIPAGKVLFGGTRVYYNTYPDSLIPADFVPAGNWVIPVDPGRMGAVMFLAAFAFVVWLFRARINLDDYSAPTPAFGLGWTIGAWLIPAANLIIPGFVVADLARNSAHPDAVRPSRSGLGALAITWWVFFLAKTLADVTASLDRVFDAHPFGRVYWQLIGVTGVLTVISAVLAILLMWRIQVAQAQLIDWHDRTPHAADFPSFTVDHLLRDTPR
jgi:hypothetical protein